MEIKMNTQIDTTPKSSVHPLIIAAAGAVVLVCGLGAAALMGWLPSSTGHNADATLSSTSQTAAERAAQAQALQANGAQQHHTAPAHHAQAPTTIASANPKSCADCGVIDAVNEVDTRGQG